MKGKKRMNEIEQSKDKSDLALVVWCELVGEESDMEESDMEESEREESGMEVSGMEESDREESDREESGMEESGMEESDTEESENTDLALVVWCELVGVVRKKCGHHCRVCRGLEGVLDEC